MYCAMLQLLAFEVISQASSTMLVFDFVSVHPVLSQELVVPLDVFRQLNVRVPVVSPLAWFIYAITEFMVEFAGIVSLWSNVALTWKGVPSTAPLSVFPTSSKF